MNDSIALNNIIMQDIFSHHLIADTCIQEAVDERVKLLKDRLNENEFKTFMEELTEQKNEYYIKDYKRATLVKNGYPS